MGIDEVIREVSRWPAEQRLALVHSLNQLTAAERMAAVTRRVGNRVAVHPLSDAEVDQAVAEVRRDRPLSQRSST